LALVSCTALQKRIPVKGILPARIIPVVTFPHSGIPDESSKIEPTAAIAVIQDPSNNTPLFGVTIDLLLNKFK
jgi:hypothetical protein